MTLLQFCFRFYNAAAKVLTPGLRNSQYEYLDRIEAAIPGTRWLDLGCGHQLVPDWMRDASTKSERLVRSARTAAGLDVHFESIAHHRHFQNRIVSDGYRLPFADNSFDLITANMVVEHVEHPAELLKEVRRVLGPDGHFVFHTTNYLNYLMVVASMIPPGLRRKVTSLLEGRAEADIFPTFYRLNTPKAIQTAASLYGYEAETIMFVNSSAITIRLGPLVIVELLVIRLLSARWAEKFRSNVIAVFRKTGEK